MKRIVFKKIVQKSLAVLLALNIFLTSFVPSLFLPISLQKADAAESCSNVPGSANLSGRVGGVALDQAATFLANMDDITGAYYDQALDRIVFVGKKNTTLPEFDKDDLAVAIKSLVFNGTIPAVSIEPPTSDDPNNSNVYFYGGIENTKFGKVLFDSDYALKHYLSGFDANNNRITSAVSGYKNMTERFIDKNPNPGPITNLTRWWIVPKLISLKRDDNANAFVFDQATMEVKTEQMSSNNDPKWNQAADEFAQHHSQYYDQFAQETPVYAEAKQLAKIVSVIKWLLDKNVDTDFNWARDYSPKIVQTPKKIPLEVVHGEYNGWSYTYAGGIAYTTPNTYTSDTTQAAALKNASQAVPTTNEDIHWTFTKDGQQYESVAVAADAFRTLGSYNTSSTDMAFPTAGDLKLGFNRSYSSYSGGQYGIGRGWNMYPAKLMDNKPGWIVSCSGQLHPWKLALQTQDGAFESFTYFNCTVGYKPDDPSFHSKIQHGSDGWFTVTLKDQTQIDFTPDLKLDSIYDKNSNYIGYDYDSAGKLINISDSKNHKISINYGLINGQNLIFNIQDWTGRKVEYGYDSQGNLLTVKDPKGGVVTYGYNDNFKLTSITDREGKLILTNTYTPEAKIANQKTPGNLDTSYVYDDTNKTITVNDNYGRVLKTIYDDKARILKQIDPFQNSVIYTYGTELSPLSIKDKNNNTTTFTYDANGNLASVKYPTNKTISYQYDGNNRLTQITDNRYGTTAKITTYTYDASGNLTRILEDSIGEKKFGYDVTGELISYYDENNQQTRWTRDDFGNKLTETLFYDNHTSTFTYDAWGRLKKQVDAEGKQITYDYDANGNVFTVTDGAGITSNEYDKENRLKKTTFPNNTTTQVAYNPLGTIASVTDSQNSLTSYGYDAYQNLNSKKDALNRQTQYVYDQLNRRKQLTTPLGNVAKWEYDANGNLNKRIDEDNNTTTYLYDNLNRLTKITYPDFKTVSLFYDDRNNLIQMVDQTGITAYTYDRFDRLKTVQNSNGTLNYQYDYAGKLTKIIYPDGKTVSYGYDSDNTLIKVTDWNNLKTDFFRYNNGLLEQKNLPNGIKGTFTYDAANRLSMVEYKKDSQVIARFTYERDAVGKITKAIEEGTFFSSVTPTPTITSTPTPTTGPTSTPTPVVTNTPTPTPTTSVGPTATPTPTPNPNGTDLIITNLSTVPANPAKNQVFSIVATVKNQGTVGISNQIIKLGYYYDLNQTPTYTTPTSASYTTSTTLVPGASQTFSYPGGFFSTSGVHSIRALADQGQTIVESNETNNTAGPLTMTLAYNNLYEQFLALTGLDNLKSIFSIPTSYAQVALPKYTNIYVYDDLGQIVTASQSAVNTKFEYTYDPVGNRLTSKKNSLLSSYTYNLDNQLTANDATNFTYDKRGNQTAAGQKTYSFNYENRLVQMSSATGINQYTYDGANNRISQSVNGSTTQFINDVSGDLTKVLATKNTSTNVSNYFVQGPEVLSEGDAAVTARKYYIYDGMGNIRFITDSNGNKLQSISYDPYGNSLETNIGAFQYKGEQTDPSGAYFMRARYYDPTTGRFISKDPVEGILVDPTSQNGYNYANNNPVNLSDPSGKNPVAVGLFLVGGLTLAGLEVGGAVYGAATSCDRSVGGIAKGALNGATDAVKSPVGQAALTAATFGAAMGSAGSAKGGVVQSTGRAIAENPDEQTAMEQVMANPASGFKLPITLGDPRWPASEGWVKMQQIVNGKNIHYNLNEKTGEVADFKFK